MTACSNYGEVEKKPSLVTQQSKKLNNVGKEEERIPQPHSEQWERQSGGR